MTRDEWVSEFCARIGVAPPTADEMTALLDLAATAAHASERPAAPLACWAAGRSDLTLEALGRIAGQIAPGSTD